MYNRFDTGMLLLILIIDKLMTPSIRIFSSFRITSGEGGSSVRFRGVFGPTGSTITSGERQKCQVLTLSARNITRFSDSNCHR